MKLDFETSISPTIVETPDFAVGSEISTERLASSNVSDSVSLKFQAGVAAARAGNRAEARLLLLEVVEIQPNNEDAWLYLASVSEYPEELLIFLNNVLRANPSNESARERVRATEKLLAANFSERGENAARTESQIDFARQCFRQAIALDDRSEAAWLGLAFAADSDDERNALFERVLDFDPQNETALSALAAAESQTLERLLAKATAEAFANDYAAVEDTLAEIFERAPENEEAWILRAFLTAAFDEKIECWETVLRINPENELAGAGTAFMRSLKSKLVTPLEREIQTRIEASDENAEENELAKTESASQSSFESADVYADFSSAAQNNAGDAAKNFEETEVYEISVGEADLPDYYEIAADEEFSLDFPAEEMSSESAAFVETEEAQSEVVTANAAAEELDFAAEGEERRAVEHADEFAEEMIKTIPCPFCSRANDALAFVCPSCMAVLTLSDLELLLANNDANREIVRQSVERMEAEKEVAEFSADELKFLGIGQINLKRFRLGFAHLQQAVQANPNDVIFSSQVNALAIRLAEIEEQTDMHSSMAKNKTILVVDDSATVRKLISGKLEKSGHAVLCAVDGMDALEKIEAMVPDLILLDITMPRMDGYTVCKMIRTNEKTKDVPVVMISGKDGFFDKVRGRMAGTTGYITKPFGPETLMKTVENYIV